MTDQPYRDVHAVLLFGSHERGDADSFSDLDVLVVVDDKSGDVSSLPIVQQAIRTDLGCDVDTTVYSLAQLRVLFAEGHLFAWHLWAEARQIGGAVDGVLEALGTPSANCDALQEICDLRLVAEELPAFESAAHSLTYECGILYVIIRNVATSATAFWGAEAIDFSFRSPWSLQRISGLEPPVSHDMMGLLRRARKAYQGYGQMDGKFIGLEEYERARVATLTWIEAVVQLLGGRDARRK